MIFKILFAHYTVKTEKAALEEGKTTCILAKSSLSKLLGLIFFFSWSPNKFPFFSKKFYNAEFCTSGKEKVMDIKSLPPPNNTFLLFWYENTEMNVVACHRISVGFEGVVELTWIFLLSFMIPKSLKSFREEFPRQRQQMVTVLAEISFVEDDVGAVLSAGRFFSRMGQCVVYLMILAQRTVSWVLAQVTHMQGWVAYDGFRTCSWSHLLATSFLAWFSLFIWKQLLLHLGPSP